MQAHHLISTTAMKLSDLGPKLRKFGYDINELQNLVLLPCTLQGACHLGVQPHRGNHTAALEDQPYKDDDHPRRYHIMVKDKLLDLQMGLQKDCPGYLGGPKVVEARLKVKRQLDDLSSEILVDVQRNPRRAPLTKVALSFQPGNPAGCCGVDSTATHIGLHDCPVKRNHQQAQGPNQRDEKITYRSMERHILKVGA